MRNKMLHKVNLINLFFKLIIASPIICTILSIFSFSLPNKFVLIMLLYGYWVWNYKKIRKKKILSFFIGNIVLITLCINAIHTSGIKILVNLDFYGLVLFLLFLLFFSDDEIIERFTMLLVKNKRQNIWHSFLFFGVNILYELFIKHESLVYMSGTFEVSHILAYYGLIFYAMTIVVLRYPISNRYKYAYLGIKVISFLVIMLSAVRSASMAVVLLMVYDYFQIKSYTKKSVFFASAIIIFAFLLYSTNVFETVPVISKTVEAINGGSITNGRERFGEYALSYYGSLDVTGKLWGTGIESIRQVMWSYVHTYIHAHNDFINIMVGYGIIYLIVAICLIVNFCKRTKFIWLLAILTILMYYNGIFMYVLFVICLPILRSSLIVNKSLEESK